MFECISFANLARVSQDCESHDNEVSTEKKIQMPVCLSILSQLEFLSFEDEREG